MNPLLMCDGYKTSHRQMYPQGTEHVYSNYTPRSVKFMPEQAKDIVVFGSQYVMGYIHEMFQEGFFNKPKEEVCGEAKEILSAYLGGDFDVSHFEALHDLGFLPIAVKSLPEGTIIKERTPCFTIINTLPEFFWVTNYLETLISTLIWKPMHSASMSLAFRKVLKRWQTKTDKDNAWVLDYQSHDFSYRGMQHNEAAISSGMGWLVASRGTDTIPALMGIKKWYGDENAGNSVPATEHSVMSAGGKEGEIETFRRLMTTFPTGILSIVSDTWDLWKVCTSILPALKEEILSRDGKIVVRPDSGNPVDIVCGKHYPSRDYRDIVDNAHVDISTPENKGVVELLWDVFGGTINEQGYKLLHPSIGVIYGDGINLDRAESICSRLEEKGFASTNVVFGVGSFSLGYATRDSQGGAVKATAVQINGELHPIFKDPVTDDGLKKSLKGLIKVNADLSVEDNVSWSDEAESELRLIYVQGSFYNRTTLAQIRERINKQI